VRAAVSTHLFAYDRLEARHLAWIAEAGFDAIELWGARHHLDFTDAAAVAELRRWLRATGLSAASIHLPFYENFGTPEFRYIGFADPAAEVRALMGEHARRLADLGAALGSRVLVLHPNNSRSAADAADRRLRAALDWFAPLCADRGLTVALENIMTRETQAVRLAAICRDYREAVSLCLDLGHANILGGLVWEIANAGAHLRAAHVHDNFGREDEHLPAGRGNIDWPAALSALRLNAPNLELFTFELAGPSGESETAAAACRGLLAEARGFWQSVQAEFAGEDA
jgi:sugar phosphate isomerase/epimerase